MNFFNRRILYVDDDEDSGELIRLLLNCEEISCDLTTAANAHEALEFIASETFDLYILDYRLSDSTGVELCRRIRRDDSSTPILFFSGMARLVDRAAAFDAGASEYLIKPNDLDRLADTTARLLRKNSPVGIAA